MKNPKQNKQKDYNFNWSFVIVCLLLAGAVLLNMVSSRGRGVVGKSNNLKITIDTAAWVTYTDKSLGITFKHPVNAFINGAGPGTEASNAVIYKGSIIQYTPLNYSYYSDFSKYYDNRNLQDVAELFYKTNIEDDNSNIPTNRFISRPEKISLAGAEAFQMNIDSGVKYPSGTNYHIDGRHKLTFLGLGDKKIVIDSKAGDFVAEEILKSFKFLDRQDLKNDWQIYINKKYGFEFQYPKDFILKEVDTKIGNNIGTKLSFDYHGSIQPMSFNIFPAPNYKDSMAAFIGVNNFADNVVKVLEKKNDIININGLLALNYCSIPGYIDYCSTFIMHNNNIFMFDYRDSIPSYYREILSTFKFLDK